MFQFFIPAVYIDHVSSDSDLIRCNFAKKNYSVLAKFTYLYMIEDYTRTLIWLPVYFEEL